MDLLLAYVDFGQQRKKLKDDRGGHPPEELNERRTTGLGELLVEKRNWI